MVELSGRLDLLKRSLPLEGEDNDELLLMLLSVAETYITQHTDIPIPIKQCEDVFDGPWRQAWLSAYPVVDVISIKTDGVDSAALYRVRKAVGSIECDSSIPSGTTVVQYTAGIPISEQLCPLDMACVLIAASLYKSGEHGGKQVTSERLGDYQVQYAATNGQGLNVLSPAAFALLKPYVRPTV
ncbi:MAG TPA: hypothetical protein PKE04_05395 [Clostridia bacterium]|nr:hypothetical protein [Clostridia bacterium]